jgi:uncharacterized OsmC-like protein
MAQLNGWCVDDITAAIEDVERRPGAGLLTWKSRVSWDGGFGLDVRTRSIGQDGGTMERHFTLRGDHPPELLGHNTGPAAIETVLAALGACMAGTFAAQATAGGIALTRLDADVEGRIDLGGFFGLRPTAPGVSDIDPIFHVESDADPAALQDVLQTTRSLSPVHDTVTTPRTVRARLATGPGDGCRAPRTGDHLDPRPAARGAQGAVAVRRREGDRPH